MWECVYDKDRDGDNDRNCWRERERDISIYTSIYTYVLDRWLETETEAESVWSEIKRKKMGQRQTENCTCMQAYNNTSNTSNSIVARFRHGQEMGRVCGSHLMTLSAKSHAMQHNPPPPCRISGAHPFPSPSPKKVKG